ncbi:MAG TPA: hypothetical protein VM222_01045 [Planctomycetota bacterium]|nr:hypothetical protein [Planctomycetota bacterium]
MWKGSSPGTTEKLLLPDLQPFLHFLGPLRVRLAPVAEVERDPILDELAAVDPNKMTPIDALKKFFDFVEKSKQK